MIKLEHIEVLGFDHAIRGMRNPLNSWHKSDSWFSDNDGASYNIVGDESYITKLKSNEIRVGSNDLKLMQNLSKAGIDHRKFMRMITVYADVTAPLYWWKEFDTYKVGTVANSCSTMHKIHDKEFTLDDFSHEYLKNEFIPAPIVSPLYSLKQTIETMNYYRNLYVNSKDKEYWWQMIQLLPNSYNQKRTVMLNYEVLANMYHSRKSHKLDEWVEFCKEIEKLPYFKEIILAEK